MDVIGRNIKIDIFGESHSDMIGCELTGVKKGLPFDKSVIDRYLYLRRPEGDLSTSRREPDELRVESGVENGETNGKAIRLVIPNVDKRPGDYSAIRTVARPSHADYTGFVKYGAASSGGGRFSGRMTAVFVAAGALFIPALESRGIKIGTHIKNIAGVSDRDFIDLKKDIESLSGKKFAVLDESAAERMQQEIIKAKADGDSVGGITETAAVGLPAGLGEPIFDNLESLISHAMFAIPGMKGIEFGAGFRFANMRGSTANDPFRIKDGIVYTESNNSGGISGGITNGMPLVFRCAFRPTPTIAKEQRTVDFVKGENVVLAAAGRHDPCIVHRARAAVDCMTAFVLADLTFGGEK